MRPRPEAVVAASVATLALGPQVAGAQQPTVPPAAGPTSATPTSAAPASAPAGALGAVHGVVHDSLTRGPLAGAYVQLVRAVDLLGRRAVAADSAGRFRIDSLAPGRYLVGFDHPLLDLLRVEVTPRVVDLGPGGDTVRVDLAIPDLARVRPVACGSPQAPTDSSGLLAGRVRDAAGNAPVANATVVLTWSELSLTPRGVRTERRRVPVTTGPGGSYVVCGVPAGEELVATAAAPGRASGEVALEVPPRGLVVRDLTLGDTGAVAVAAARAARGTARLTGTVRDPAGRAVRGARVSVWGTAAATTAGADGAFTLGGLPAGTRTLEVRAIGFAMRRVPVDLAAGRAGTVDVRLDRVATLDPVTVFGTPSRPSQRLAEFFDRRRHNPFGRFLTAADLERRRPIEVTEALRGVAGVQVVPGGRLGNAILGRGKGFGSCRAVVVLDGLALEPNDALDRFVSPQAVAGIEVYPDASFAPPEYGGARRNGCSVVLVWTR
jgi:hypothetical protein